MAARCGPTPATRSVTRGSAASTWTTSAIGIRTSGGADLPKNKYGFPEVPGVLAAARRPFLASGLGLPWYAVHGNHDNMLQGTVPAAGWLHQVPVTGVKYVTPPADIDAADVLRRFDASDGEALADLIGGRSLPVTPDPGRAAITRATHVREHFRTTGRPGGHGYSLRNADEGTAYYGFNHGIVRCLVLDTVNPHGGWQGSLDAGQLDWLAAQLTSCADRPVVLFSHHPLETLINDRRPPEPAVGYSRPSYEMCCSAIRAWSPG